MGFIKKQFSLWRIVLIVGAAAVVIPFAFRLSPAAMAIVKERQDYPDRQTIAGNEDAGAKAGKDRQAAAGELVVRQQDDYYDRRREYWERRVERRLEDNEEYLDEETVD